MCICIWSYICQHSFTDMLFALLCCFVIVCSRCLLLVNVITVGVCCFVLF